MNTTGSFHSAAKFSDSWKDPILTAASPKKQSVTRGCLRYLEAKAAPTASGI
jgi:hypothetical protein